MFSTCCGAPPYLDNWHEEGGITFGICSACGEHCEFEGEEDERI